MIRRTFWSLSLALLLYLPVTRAQESPDSAIDKNDPEQVLAYQGDAVLTQQAIDAAFSRIPEDNRLMFIRDGGQVDRMVRNLLQAQIVANDARSAGFADDPLVRERIALAVDKELAEAWLQELKHRVPEADYEAMAHEDYLAHPEHYSTGVTLDVSHILIGTDERSEADAAILARHLKDELDADPSRFDEFVMEYSDDPAKSTNHGRYKAMRKGMMVRPFEQAAYGLKQPGDISDPVKTEYGFHLIRLDARHDAVVPPFEEIKDQAVEQARRRHVENYRNAYLQKLLAEPVTFPEGSVEVMARRHFGENLEKAPAFDTNSEH